jgi:hypothetical protein
MIFLSFPLLTPARGAETKPNVVIIFIDDLGYADIGPFGATKQKTPHLDRMAAETPRLRVDAAPAPHRGLCTLHRRDGPTKENALTPELPC